MTYIDNILLMLKNAEIGEPIYSKQLAEELSACFAIDKEKAIRATAVAIKRIIDKNTLPGLRCYQKGIYYRTRMTPFGEVGINRERLIADKYLLPNNGYETGFMLLHNLGLATQMPRERIIVTNAAKKCMRYDSKLGVTIRPPKATVNEGNQSYFQILDALELFGKSPIDVDDPYHIFAHHIDSAGLKYEKLLSLADRYYSRNTLEQLAHTASKGGKC